MKSKILIFLIGCAMAFTFNTRAVEGGMGHYVPGAFSDFSGMPPDQPGLFLGSTFHDYGNATANASEQLPLGGILAAGVTYNVQSPSLGVVYAYPWRPGNFTFSTGVDPSWV